MTTLFIDALVRRHMSGTGRYTEGCGFSAPLEVTGEVVVGWYRNPPPWEASLIVFTDKAAYSVEEGRTIRVGYADIEGYELPSKSDPSGVRVRTRDGFRFLRAAGAFGPNDARKDAFSVVMLVRALIRANEMGATLLIACEQSKK